MKGKKESNEKDISYSYKCLAGRDAQGHQVQAVESWSAAAGCDTCVGCASRPLMHCKITKALW